MILILPSDTSRTRLYRNEKPMGPVKPVGGIARVTFVSVAMANVPPSTARAPLFKRRGHTTVASGKDAGLRLQLRMEYEVTIGTEGWGDWNQDGNSDSQLRQRRVADESDSNFSWSRLAPLRVPFFALWLFWCSVGARVDWVVLWWQ